MRPHAVAIIIGVAGIQQAVTAASQTYAATLASIYGLPTSTSLPFPTTTIAAPDAQSWITAGASSDNLGWSLSKGRLENGGNNLAFVADPFPSASLVKDPDISASTYAGPVLQVAYPAGSYSGQTGGGAYFCLQPGGAVSSSQCVTGAQFVQLWNTTSDLQSMILSYEIAFDSGFNFVKASTRYSGGFSYFWNDISLDD